MNDIWTHVKTGGEYQVLHYNVIIEATMTPAIVYRSLKDYQVWVRPKSEFMDGRFELRHGCPHCGYNHPPDGICV